MLNVSNFKLKELCTENSWFTCGTSRQYDKLFEANDNDETLENIALIIWLCSDDIWTKENIQKIIKDAECGITKSNPSNNQFSYPFIL